MYYGLTAIN